MLIAAEAETRLADAELPALTDQVRKAKSDIQLQLISTDAGEDMTVFAQRRFRLPEALDGIPATL